MPLTHTEQISDLNSRVGRLEMALKRIEAALTPTAPKPQGPTKPPAWAGPQNPDQGSHANPTPEYDEAMRAASAPAPRKAGPWKDPFGQWRDERGEIVPAKAAEVPRGPEQNRQPAFVDEVIDRMTPLTVNGGR